MNILTTSTPGAYTVVVVNHITGKWWHTSACTFTGDAGTLQRIADALNYEHRNCTNGDASTQYMVIPRIIGDPPLKDRQ